MNQKKNGNALALLPIGVFLVIFIGAGVLSRDFYTMPAIVGFLIALMVAFMQNRRVRFADKMTIISKGIGEENIVTMCLIFLAAGAFSGTIKAAGGVESTVNLGLSIMPASIAVMGLFIIGWVFLFFHGNFCGNHYSHGSHWSGNCRKDGNFSACLHGRYCVRRHVRRQSFHDFRYHHCGCENPGM